LAGCGSDPSGPGTKEVGNQPPAQLPDDFPAVGNGADSASVPPGGDPGNPLPPERMGMWVRFRAFNDATRPDLGLWILHGGRAAAMSLNEGPPAHHAWLDADTLRIVARWFEVAGFRDVARESYFGAGDPGRICDIFLAEEDGTTHRVIGDFASLPPAVRQLALDLEGLTVHVLATSPSGPPTPPPGDSTWVPPPPPPPPPGDSTWVPPPVQALRGELSVEPVSAPAGTARTLRLAVTNVSQDTVQLRFRTSQLYDFMIMGRYEVPPSGGDSTWVPPNPPPGGDSTWVPPNPPPGGGPGVPPGGGCPGGIGGHGDGHADPGDPGMPPDSMMVPPDSMMVPPDSVGVPPVPRMVWNWAHDQSFPSVETSLRLLPGESLVYIETWDGHDNDGALVGAGVYPLMAPLLSDFPVMSGMARLEVTGR
jgi:hypothetical protein